MRYSVVIPAAGKGERLGLGYNKVLYRSDNVSIIEKTKTKSRHSRKNI